MKLRGHLARGHGNVDAVDVEHESDGAQDPDDGPAGVTATSSFPHSLAAPPSKLTRLPWGAQFFGRFARPCGKLGNICENQDQRLRNLAMRTAHRASDRRLHLPL